MLRTHAPRVAHCPPRRALQVSIPRNRVFPVIRAQSSGDATNATVAPVDTRTAQNNVQPMPQRWSGHRNSKQLVAKRQQELDQRRFYMKNQWYCVALSKNLRKDKPLGVEILGQNVVLFRDEDGRVCCMADTCPHRGAPLSHGWVDRKVGDGNHTCVVCPYHGWAIDGNGVLQDVPAAEKKANWNTMGPVVPVYPVEEKGGFVWLFNGSTKVPEDARPPIPYTPELDDPSWKAVYAEVEFNINHWPVFENAIDMAHIHYLHADSFGNQESPEIRDMKTHGDDHVVTATFRLKNKPVNPLWAWTSVPEVHVVAKAFLPSTSLVTFTLGNGLSFTTFVNVVPINEHKTINRFCLVRKLGWDVTGIFNWSAWDKFAERAMIQILTEDRAMVEHLRPEVLPREISVRADQLQIQWRKLRQSYVDLGYGVDPRSTAMDLPVDRTVDVE